MVTTGGEDAASELKYHILIVFILSPNGQNVKNKNK